MKKYRNLFLGTMILMGASACSLDETPSSYYDKGNYFTTAENVQMLITGIESTLSDLNHYGQFEMAMPCSDDTYYIQGTGTDNTRRDIAHYMVKTHNKWVTSVWELKYQGIDRANMAIEGIVKMDGYENSDLLKKTVAEASFLRAFLAFDLVKYWGDVPFKTTSSGSYGAAFGPRVSREKIYDQIIEDLDFAKNHLTKDGAKVSPETITQGAARALLMRVLLQRAGYSLQMDGNLTRPADDVRKACFEKVLAEWNEFQKLGHKFTPSYEQLFRNFSAEVLDSQESIWEIAFNPTGNAFRVNSGTWGTYNGPLVELPKGAKNPNEQMGRANAFFKAVPEWKDFFEEKDERRDVMVCTYKYVWNQKEQMHKKTEQKKRSDWYPGKWRREWMKRGYVDPNNTGVNYCVLRYADVVLMAAEAHNELGNTDEALKLLNSVRERAKATPLTMENYAQLLKAPKVYNLPFIDDADPQGKIRTALYWERGFELAFEGQRKYDLIRWGVLDKALKLFEEKTDKSLKGKYIAGSNFVSGKHELFPIPLDEIQANPQLENQNNPGY